MGAPYGFGLSQEDERTEARGLRLARGDRVLSIASAGEMPLSLLALGADEVLAVDTDARQLYLTELKLSAIRALERLDALRFLGYLPAPGSERWRLFEVVAPLLPDGRRAFWLAHRRAIDQGPVWAGRYERYIRTLLALTRPLLSQTSREALFQQPTLDAQREHFDRAIGRPVVRAIFRLAFNPRVFARGGMDPRSLRHRRSPQALGEQYFQRFRGFCTDHPARENHLLQLTLLGRLVDQAASPACLTPEGIAVLRARHSRLELRHGDVVACLRGEPPGRFNKVHLSNLADWLSQAEFDALLEALAGRVARPGRAVWRFLHVDRQVPVALRGQLRVEAQLGAALSASDRFPFYGVVPVSIEGPP